MDVATGATASLLPKLEDLLSNKYKLQPSTRDDIEYLSQQIQKMQDVLLKLVEAPRDQLNDQVKLWAEAARKLSNDLEVVVDEFLRTSSWEGFIKGLVEKTGSVLKKGKTPHQIITSAIRHIKAEVQILADRCKQYGISDFIANPQVSIDPRLVFLYKHDIEFVGTDGKTQELVKLLLAGDNVSNEKVKVVSVIGFGGLGKTTLVKQVYDKIKMRFDCNAFVVAGQSPDFKKILLDIIRKLTWNEKELIGKQKEQELIEKLRGILYNKRYLIVVDDICDGRLWKFIRHALPSENNLGSRIITTTRIVSVSEACCSSADDSVYQMEPMSDDDSKTLLYHTIFGSANGCPYEFEQVSSDILKKCGGVPLAIITMASYFATKPKDEWHVLLKSFASKATEDTSWKEMRLVFTYYDLPPRLRTCLLYLSIFPVGHPIESDRLVKKWITEGIIIQELSREEAASRYLDELVDRNVIQPLEHNKHGEAISYYVHPMMHNVLKDIAIEEKFAASVGENDISSPRRMNFRNLSIDCPNSENLIDLSSMAFEHEVQSLTIFGHANQSLLKKFEGIRVLDLEGCKSIGGADLEYICSIILLKRLCLARTHIIELPPQIGNLQYLEGLDVGGTQITELPPQICKLQRLKTLDVGGTQITELPPQIGRLQLLKILDVGGTQITKLPPQIGKLQHLKILDARKSGIQEIPDHVLRLTGLVHLLIGDSESNEGVKLPDGIGKMKSLQQLCTIDLRKCSASCLKELVELPFLKDIAVVGGDEPGCTLMNNALLSSLDKSTELRSLVVYTDFRLRILESSSPYNYLNCRKKLTVVKSLKVPTSIAGHHLLSMLDIRVCKLEEDDLKILRQLPRLQSLIVRLEVLPKEMIHISCDGFAKLECFCIDCRMPRVTFEEGTMPKLEHLELKLYAGSASEDNMGIKHLLRLQKITLRYSKWHTNNMGVRETTEAVKTECQEHQNEITLCIAEEEKGGKCIPKTEIFQENRVASCSRMTEIEKEQDTQEGGLHQSSHDIVSCSGTSEIEEVVE